MPRWTKDLNVTLRGMTRTTERAAHRRGVGYFLPTLFVDRFSRMGGIDRAVFERQLAGCRSFEDEAWANYWRAFADEQFESARASLARMGGRGAPDSLEEGHRTQEWLATADAGEIDPVTGGYWYHRHPRAPHPAAADPDLQARLVDRLAQETGVALTAR